jgi:hypothetical protein
MTDQAHRFSDVAVFELGGQGPPIETERDALDVLSAGWSARADLVAIPVSRLAPEVFTLANGKLGAMLQKFTNYRMRVAIVGDLAAPLTASGALRDFVRESNRGLGIWFVADMAALAARLA